jgi:diguanylate cyclase (GGDEF)-like protein
LVTASLSAAGLAFVGHGLRDVALLILPTVLVFAGLLRTRRILTLLVVLQLVLVFVIAWIYQPSPALVPTSQMILALTLMPILGMTAYAMGHLTQDLRESLARTESSMAALQTSHRVDALTGLPNRRAADEALSARYAANPYGQVAVAMLNVDGFRAINDAFGPQIGDRVLVALSARWQGLLGRGETLYRLSGDEFLLTQEANWADDTLVRWAQRFVEATRTPLDFEGFEMRCTVSAGVTPSASASNYAELLSQLDAAVRQARDHGRNGVARYIPQWHGDQSRKLKLLMAMRESLQRGQDFSLVYQPKVDIHSGRLLGAEALLRWTHPLHGPVSPAEFIPLAESSGLIVELGRWVLREACQQAQGWRQAAWTDFSIAVNVSVMQCQRHDLVLDVQASLDATGLPPSALVLELTETMLVQGADTLHDNLQRLHRMGVALAIDDFGTGYSNLGYLSRMNIQQLKIDQSFVQRMGHSPSDRAIVEAILGLAHQLGLSVVAEGIEDGRCAQSLLAMGCQVGQGLHWSGPLQASDFRRQYESDDANAEV